MGKPGGWRAVAWATAEATVLLTAYGGLVLLAWAVWGPE